MSTRSASRSRTTKETSIDITIDLDGTGLCDVTTGLPFFDHMLDQLGRHGGFDLKVHATGDLEIDAHHTVEDVGIALGEVDPPGEKILGDPPFDPQLVEEFWRAFITSAGITLHQVLVRGKNTHHIIESTFKGTARALRDAVRVEGGGIPSTKGVL
jgi:imidazoleglycerol-phosphate dehydratase